MTPEGNPLPETVYAVPVTGRSGFKMTDALAGGYVLRTQVAADTDGVGADNQAVSVAARIAATSGNLRNDVRMVYPD